MMKIKITVIIFLSVFALSSCSKKFDTQPFDRISGDVVWSSKANAETFIFSTYGLMYNYASGPGTDPYTLNTLGFDDIYNGAQSVFTGTFDKTADFGFNNWGTIRRCNQIITQVGASTGISDADKVALIAEGKFLRAMSYFDVARRIGRIVWINTVLAPTDSLLLHSTANPTESYKYIIQDLSDAIQGLPTTKIPGRANKYVAESFMTEVCLEAMAYENYPNAPANNPSDPLLDTVMKYGNDVIANGGYSLVSDYGSMFNDVAPTSSETIFAIYNTKLTTAVDNTPMQLYMLNVNNDAIKRFGGSPLFTSDATPFIAWVQHGPTNNLAEDYLVIDKADPTKALPWDQTSQFNAAIDQNASIPSSGNYNKEIPQAGGETSIEHGVVKPGSADNIWTLTNDGRDARYAASFISDSTQFYGQTITTDVHGNASRWSKIVGESYYVSLTNLYWKKGVYTNIPAPAFYYSTPTDYHYMCMRLGRVYLNMAEAYLLKNDVADAVAAFNMTRTVHGKLPPSTASDLATAWTDYKRERRVDLTLENDYYYSLLRWGRYGGPANHGNGGGGTIQELTQVPQVMDISKDLSSFSVVTGSFFGSNNVRVFDASKRYLFPIAQGYLDNNPNFGPQNPNW